MEQAYALAGITFRGKKLLSYQGALTAYCQRAPIGDGSLGGKGRGLAFIDNMVKRYPAFEEFENARVAIPKTVDVYKRQIELTQEELKQHFSEPIFGQIAETADALGLECYVAVSYTHLDVYKRQRVP